MHRTLTFCDFCDAFRACDRNENFSYKAKRILFDYLEQLEEDLGESIELDVVALCCDYSEVTLKEMQGYYSACRDMSEDEIRAYLNYHTQVCGEFTDDNGDVVFVFQVF